MSSYIARLKREELDFDCYAALLREKFQTYDIGRHREFIRWLYEDNPEIDVTRDLPIYVFWDGGEPLGQLGILPCPFVVDGTDLQSGWCVDFYVTAKAQRRGLGVKLLQAAHADLPLLSTLGQSDLAYNFFLKNNWQMHGHLTCCKMLLNKYKSISKMVLHKGGLLSRTQTDSSPVSVWKGAKVGNVTIAELSDYRECKALLAARNAGERAFVRRSVEFMNWRYIHCPHDEYVNLRLAVGDMEAVGVLRLFRYAGWLRGNLVDFIYDDNNNSESVAVFIRAIVDIARKSKIDVLELETSDERIIRACPDDLLSVRQKTFRFMTGRRDGSNPEHTPIENWKLFIGDCDIDIVNCVHTGAK